MRRAAALALALVASASAQFEDDDMGFEAWVGAAAKTYSSPEEATYRREIFDANAQRIKSHNAEADRLGYVMGLNQFADLTADEWESLYTSRGLLLPESDPAVGGTGDDVEAGPPVPYWGSGWEAPPFKKWEPASSASPSPSTSASASPSATPDNVDPEPSKSATPYPVRPSSSSSPSGSASPSGSPAAPVPSASSTPWAFPDSDPSPVPSQSSSPSPKASASKAASASRTPTRSPSKKPSASRSPSRTPVPYVYPSSSSSPTADPADPTPTPAPTPVVPTPTGDGVDWEQLGMVTPVKNQGSCGSCYSFGASGAIESFWAIKGNPLVSLSQQQIIDCTTNSGCGGGYITYSLQSGVAGLCSEASYPYTSSKGACRASSCAVVARTAGYRSVPASQSALEAAVRINPVTVAVDAGGQTWQFYRSGVVTSGCGTALNHAVILVGFGTDAATGSSYYRIKNSWGSGWGEAGYIRLGRGAQFGSSGVCGVQMQGAYPV